MDRPGFGNPRIYPSLLLPQSLGYPAGTVKQGYDGMSALAVLSAAEANSPLTFGYITKALSTW
jgi:hypothetical protein